MLYPGDPPPVAGSLLEDPPSPVTGVGGAGPYEIQIPPRPRPIIDLEALASVARLTEMKNQMEFIRALRRASLDDAIMNLAPDAIERL